MTAPMERIGDRLTFPGERIAGQQARRAVRDRAAKVIADDDALDDLELMSAEAVANAVLHGSGPIDVDVLGDGASLRVEVRDRGPAESEEDGQTRIDHGRGLMVIDALATAWGLEYDSAGTTLWFALEL